MSDRHPDYEAEFLDPEQFMTASIVRFGLTKSISWKRGGTLSNEDERHDMKVYVGGTGAFVDTTAQYISVFFPDLGNVTITYETRPDSDRKRPVLSFDFDTGKVDIIDAFGGDREIQ